MPSRGHPLIGAFRHCALWLKSKSEDLIFKNANFNPAFGKGYVIYCVHGTADRNASFTHFIENIQASLPDFVASIRCVSFENRAEGESIDGFSRQLKAMINRNGDRDVILVGHSRGGLVASDYAENHAAKNNVNIHLVTTLCSPFNGAIPIYRPGSLISASVGQMMKNSEYLNRLNDQVKASKTKYIHVGADKDKIIAEGAYAPPGSEVEHQLLLQNEGHLSAVSAIPTSQFFLQHLNEIPRPEHLLQTEHTDVQLNDIQQVMVRLKFHCDKLPDAALAHLKRRDREGYDKQLHLAGLLIRLKDCGEDLQAIKTIVDQALVSGYHKARQTNPLLINRGTTHLHWVKSIFTGKINPVSHRLSRSTTEDILIDLKRAVEAAIAPPKERVYCAR